MMHQDLSLAVFDHFKKVLQCTNEDAPSFRIEKGIGGGGVGGEEFIITQFTFVGKLVGTSKMI